MTISLEAQYESVLKTVFGYGEFAVRIFQRFGLRVWLFGAHGSRPVLLEQWARRNLLRSAGASLEMRQLIDRFIKDEERDNPFCDVILSEFPLEALAVHIEALNPDVDFSQVARLYDQRARPIWRVSLKVLITSIFGIGLVFINSIPDSLIEVLFSSDTFGVLPPVEGFHLVAFLVTVLVIFLIVVVWVNSWFEGGGWYEAWMGVVRDAFAYLAIRGTRPGVCKSSKDLGHNGLKVKRDL